jgi:hypothetical protein
LLGISGDPHGNQAIALKTQPFVIDGKTQFAHINSSLFRLIHCWWRMAIGRLVPGNERGLRVDSKGGANVYLSI